LIVVSAEERIIFGQCGCPFFKDNLLNRGPCPHMLALFELSATARTAGASS
jgi:predicted nucleic acid-binding Zn finger protein